MSSASAPLEVVLALGGGAARGLSHIGIIRVLEAEGVVIRGVAGTSIGAVVGGTYCAGHLDAFEAKMRAMKPRGLLRLLDLVLPRAALLGGERVMKQLAGMVGEAELASLPVPFAAVATDLATGEEIVLQEGRLLDVMRASWAIPGIFAPVRLGGRWLVDGGISRPLPIRAASELAAGLPVIAVNMNHSELRFQGRANPLLEAAAGDGAPPPNLAFSVNAAVGFLQEKITVLQLAQAPPHLLLEPALGGVADVDFHLAHALIRAGAECAQRAIDAGGLAQLAAVTAR